MTKEQGFDFIAEAVTNWANPYECKDEKSMLIALTYIKTTIETVHKDEQIRDDEIYHSR